MTAQITHPTGSRLVFQTESQLGKRLGLLSFGNRSPLFIDQATVASAFLRLTCLHLSVLCHLWSTVECRLHSPFSSLSLGEGCQQKCQLVPVATPLPSLIKQTWTVMMSLQKRTDSAGIRELATKVWERRFTKS